MALPVQKQVPIPKTVRPTVRRTRKYPFDTMLVGDMFFIPNRDRNTFSTHASWSGKQLGRKFTTRLMHMHKVDGSWRPCEPDDPNAVMGIGVWRSA